MTSYFPGDRDKESTHSPFSPCTNRFSCVRCWGNFAETNRLALNGLKLWSPVTRVSSEAEALGAGRATSPTGRPACYVRMRTLFVNLRARRILNCPRVADSPGRLREARDSVHINIARIVFLDCRVLQLL